MSYRSLNMPCVCRERCLIQASPDGANTGHRCPRCNHYVHVICGRPNPDPTASIACSHYCLNCYEIQFGDGHKQQSSDGENSLDLDTKPKAKPSLRKSKAKPLSILDQHKKQKVASLSTQQQAKPSTISVKANPSSKKQKKQISDGENSSDLDTKPKAKPSLRKSKAKPLSILDQHKKQKVASLSTQQQAKPSTISVKANPSSKKQKSKTSSTNPKKTTTKAKKKRKPCKPRQPPKKLEIAMKDLEDDEKKDSFLGCQVAFPKSGLDTPSWLQDTHIPFDAFTEIDGQSYLLGTVIKAEKSSFYMVE